MVLKVVAAVSQPVLIRRHDPLGQFRMLLTNLRPHVALTRHPSLFHRAVVVPPKERDADNDRNEKPQSTITLKTPWVRSTIALQLRYQSDRNPGPAARAQDEVRQSKRSTSSRFSYRYDSRR